MRIDGSTSNLGEFDGATTYPIAMPVMLFIAAATLVSFIIHGLAKRFVFGLIGLAGLSSATWISSLVATRNIVALDPQLERLTGIAKTHGVADLQVNTTFFPWAWAALTFFVAIGAIYLATTKSSWFRVQQPKSGNKPEATTTIDLWEQQRD